MKTKLLLLATSFLFASNAFAQPASNPSTLPYYESFNYPDGGTLIGQGNWDFNGTGTFDEIIVDENLTYTGLPTSAGRALNFRGGGPDPLKHFDPQTTGTTYFSFLVRINPQTTDFYTAAVGAPIQFISLGLQSATPANTNYGSCVMIRRIDATNTINFGYNIDSQSTNSIWDATNIQVGTTYFVVASFTYDGTTPVGKLWINPVIAPTEPAASVTSTTFTNNRAQLDRVFIRQDSNARTPDMTIDELRVGTSWNAVTGTTLGVNTNSISAVSIYPNPAKNKFNINTNGIEIDQVSVFNLDGKMVLQSKNISNTVDVSSLAKGVYLVKLQSANDQTTQKLIIE